jgi:hypothetical protein
MICLKRFGLVLLLLLLSSAAWSQVSLSAEQVEKLKAAWTQQGIALNELTILSKNQQIEIQQLKKSLTDLSTLLDESRQANKILTEQLQPLELTMTKLAKSLDLKQTEATIVEMLLAISAGFNVYQFATRK